MRSEPLPWAQICLGADIPLGSDPASHRCMHMSGLRAIRFASFICVGHGGEMESPPADKLVELRAADTDRRQTLSPA